MENCRRDNTVLLNYAQKMCENDGDVKKVSQFYEKASLLSI